MLISDCCVVHSQTTVSVFSFPLRARFRFVTCFALDAGQQASRLGVFLKLFLNSKRAAGCAEATCLINISDLTFLYLSFFFFFFGGQ